MIAAMGPDPVVEAIVERLAVAGFAVVRRVLPDTALADLRAHVHALDASGAFAEARTGRDAAASAAHVRARGDRIAWLPEAPGAPCEAPVRALVEALRIASNRALFLGIDSHELHYAIYPPGAGYVRHRDRFRDDDARVLSFVLYLNTQWRADDGGALRVHFETREHGAPQHVDVIPEGGTAVVFLSERFEHEVLPARRERASLTGWLRRRALPP